MPHKVMVMGDLHISDVYSGRHVDYLQNSIDVLEMVTKEIEGNNVTHLFLLGDIVGLNEKNLKYRDTLLYVIQVFKRWGDFLNGNVYSVRGNHDIGGRTTDFDFLRSLGYLKTCDYLDVGNARFHFIDYGDEGRVISVEDEKYNVALMHNNIQIRGLTTWFRAKGGVELSTLDNLYGVELVIAGHIHNPSIRLISTSIKDKEVSLYYPGCPTRPRYETNIWDQCFAPIFDIDDNDVSINQVTFNLKPSKDLFSDIYEDMGDEEVLQDGEPIIDIEELSKILSELETYNIKGGFDYREQIKRFAGLDKEAADLALSYLDKIEGGLK